VWQRLAVRHGKEFVKHVAPAIVKPARTLWNEVIGFFFIVFAVTFGSKAVRLYLSYNSAPEQNKGPALLWFFVALFCTLLMVWFGVTSFLKARKISRS
jgi:hypothetical protein